MPVLSVALFDAASYEVPAALMDLAAPEGPTVVIPTVFALVETDRGVIAVDCGPRAQDAPPESRGIGPAAALAALGAPADRLMSIVCTHLHLDHVGGIEELPGVPLVCQRDELAYAAAPEAHMAPEYLPESHLTGRSLVALDGDTDLLGDGSFRLLRSPGHTPGHQSVLLRLASGSHVLLAGDALWTVACREGATPGLLTSFEDFRASRTRLRDLAARTRARWVHSHEPGTFGPEGWPHGEPIR